MVRSGTPRIAIVGGGIAGIACSWELQKHNCAVDIYESDSKLGGHANSVPFKGNGKTVNVDSGFIVMDEATYPHFNAFLGELGVKTIPTDMSFGVSTTEGAFDWSSYSLLNFIVSDIQQKEATESFGKGTYDDIFKKDVMEEPLESIGDYLKRKGYSERFINYCLIPMVASPWSTDPDEFARTFPAKFLIQFMLRCGLIDTVIKRLQWRSFQNGSQTYVEAFQRSLPSCHQLHLNTPVQRVVRIGKKVSLIFSDHSSETFDYVVLAIHANQALTLLRDSATILERKILSYFKTSRNISYLHLDESVGTDTNLV
ncbi:FAD/NAD(P)-binding domain-containing protein [Hypoxylon sp. EC38]|nr:FAD/NAD(P)-binding domain-containing protein [Hypoxylon sp. EC38]